MNTQAIIDAAPKDGKGEPLYLDCFAWLIVDGKPEPGYVRQIIQLGPDDVTVTFRRGLHCHRVKASEVYREKPQTDSDG